MNLSDLRRAAQHADTIPGNGRTRLTDVHLRIRAARRRRTAAVAGAVAVAVVLGGVTVTRVWPAAEVNSPAGPTSAPSPVDIEPAWCTASTKAPPTGRVGFMGLPPVGAVPSRTRPADLVLEWFGPDGHGNGNVWLFADGRLIVEREKDLPEGATDRQTGYLERCLSSYGVESLRRYVLQTGKVLPVAPSGTTWLRARAGANGPLIDLDPASVDNDRLMEPESWLGAIDWVDRRYRPYVPTTYAFCADESGTGTTSPDDLARIPRRAADLLRPLPWTVWDDVHLGRWLSCATVPTPRARELVRIFDEEWFGPGYRGEPAVLDVGLIWRETSTVTDANRIGALIVSIEPVLPDGQLTCNC